MSALACLAHEDGAIQAVFLTDEYTAYGCYKLRLFDKRANKKVTVVIDDMIPVKRHFKCNFCQAPRRSVGRFDREGDGQVQGKL